jgi:hypothetical protein
MERFRSDRALNRKIPTIGLINGGYTATSPASAGNSFRLGPFFLGEIVPVYVAVTQYNQFSAN